MTRLMWAAAVVAVALCVAACAIAGTWLGELLADGAP